MELESFQTRISVRLDRPFGDIEQFFLHGGGQYVFVSHVGNFAVAKDVPTDGTFLLGRLRENEFRTRQGSRFLALSVAGLAILHNRQEDSWTINGEPAHRHMYDNDYNCPQK